MGKRNFKWLLKVDFIVGKRRGEVCQAMGYRRKP